MLTMAEFVNSLKLNDKQQKSNVEKIRTKKKEKVGYVKILCVNLKD